MIICSSFRKIETKKLNSNEYILIFLVLETTSTAALGYLNIRSDNEIETFFRGLS